MPELARLISKSSITVSHPDGTVYEKSVRSRVGRFPRWHSKAPGSASLDLSLSDAAFRTYTVMGLKTDGNVCSVGVRYLARIMGRGKSAVARSIQELVELGHLEPLKTGNGQRARYRFTSAAYLRTCPQCKRRTDQIRPSGVCWVCDEKALAVGRGAA